MNPNDSAETDNSSTSRCTPALPWGFARECKPLFRRRTAAIPASTRQKVQKPFLASPPALRTQQLVGFRSLATQRAASIPLPARERSFSTPQTKIRPLARRRFYSTPPASTIPPLERPPFYTIRLPRKTRPLERSPFLATPRATSTRPSELALFFNTTGVRQHGHG